MSGLPRAVAVAAAGTWPAEAAVATVTLAYGDRHRRRRRLVDDAGVPFLLDLPQAAHLAEGDGLVLEGGGFVQVAAAPEDLAEVVCSTPVLLARIAWHLGNRHLAVEIAGDRLRLAWDHVIADMLAGLGAAVQRIQAPFNPEPGAYAGGPGHGHDHD